MPTPQAQPNYFLNPMSYNALEGVKAEFGTKIPLLLAAEAQRTGGVVVGDRLFKNREAANLYIAEVKAAGGPLAGQIDHLVADFSQLGSDESRLAEDARLQGLQLTEGQKLAKQYETQRLTDLGGNSTNGLAKGYNDLNLMLQGDSARYSAALDDEINPEQAAIRRRIGAQVQSDLELGNNLSDSQRRTTEQAIRSGQAARGNILGNASLLHEADALMTEGDRQQNIRQARGYAFLEGGGRNTGFGTTAAGGASLNATGVDNNQDQDFGGLNPNAGEWGTSTLPNQPQKKKKSNGWGQILGTVAGIALGAVTGGAGYALAAGAMAASAGAKKQGEG